MIPDVQLALVDADTNMECHDLEPGESWLCHDPYGDDESNGNMSSNGSNGSKESAGVNGKPRSASRDGVDAEVRRCLREGGDGGDGGARDKRLGGLRMRMEEPEPSAEPDARATSNGSSVGGSVGSLGGSKLVRRADAMVPAEAAHMHQATAMPVVASTTTDAASPADEIETTNTNTNTKAHEEDADAEEEEEEKEAHYRFLFGDVDKSGEGRGGQDEVEVEGENAGGDGVAAESAAVGSVGDDAEDLNGSDPHSTDKSTDKATAPPPPRRRFAIAVLLETNERSSLNLNALMEWMELIMNQSLHEFVIEYSARAALSAHSYSKLTRDLTQFEEGELGGAGGAGERHGVQTDGEWGGRGGKERARDREDGRGRGRGQGRGRGRSKGRGADLLLESLDVMIDAREGAPKVSGREVGRYSGSASSSGMGSVLHRLPVASCVS